ncbi:MAG: NTP transferase domain-containing protein [Actinotalea sp.]|nr:NTP transferase domain-containing protein [Actinotalea sp.]
MTTLPHDVVVLAGGRGRRLRTVSKADVRVAGRSLLDRALDAAVSAEAVVVVGRAELARPGVITVLEDPPDGGPVAGIDAGMGALDALPGRRPGHVVVLACDVPFAADVVPGLLAAAQGAPGADGAWAVDGDGRAQPLLAVYRREALLEALERRREDGGVRDCSVRRLVAGLVPVPVREAGVGAADVDTWEAVADLARTFHRRTDVTDVPPAAPVGGDELHRWVAHLVDALDVRPDAVDIEGLLDLARDTAHGVARPAVPLTAFLAGYAVAARGGDRAAFESVVQQVNALVAHWAEGRSASS